ncbi:MAG TPA: iron ABC transporter permease [Anaerolineales bacterium]|nr:iron ABC transporter permease [Anaerolineales bacterium]
MLQRHPFLANLAFLIFAVILSIAVGSVFIPPETLARMLAERVLGAGSGADWPASFAAILFDVRIPHTALVLLTGAALGGSGAAYQGLFRNPLADPYLIGVASGAGLGAVLALTGRWPVTWGGYLSVPAAAFLGGLATVLLVYSLSRTGRTLPVTTLILAGVAISAFTSAVTSYLMLRSEDELRRAIAWLLGGSPAAGWPPVFAVAPYLLVGMAGLLSAGHALNVLQFGEEQAGQLGLPVGRAKGLIIVAASLTTAAAVAFSGIIGFIGLVVPHIVRLVWGEDYRRLIPLAMLGGSTALLLSDLAARVVLAPQTLPVGIVTALAGAPFFLWLLRQARRRAYW